MFGGYDGAKCFNAPWTQWGEHYAVLENHAREICRVHMASQVSRKRPILNLWIGQIWTIFPVYWAHVDTLRYSKSVIMWLGLWPRTWTSSILKRWRGCSQIFLVLCHKRGTPTPWQLLGQRDSEMLHMIRNRWVRAMVLLIASTALLCWTSQHTDALPNQLVAFGRPLYLYPIYYIHYPQASWSQGH
jgi:hypothetical protein